MCAVHICYHLTVNLWYEENVWRVNSIEKPTELQLEFGPSRQDSGNVGKVKLERQRKRLRTRWRKGKTKIWDTEIKKGRR